MNRPSNEASVVVGVTKFAAMFGRSRWWAKAKFERWLDEQNRGGPVRVWYSGKKRRLLYTTLAVVQREFPGATRDPIVMRKLKEHDRDMDQLARRIDSLMGEVRMLRKMLEPKSGVRAVSA